MKKKNIKAKIQQDHKWTHWQTTPELLSPEAECKSSPLVSKLRISVTPAHKESWPTRSNNERTEHRGGVSTSQHHLASRLEI